MSKEPIYLSVVLSTYNDEKYIAESINSILTQTYPYFEFIIVNDGSTDKTLDIIKSFKDDRIILIDKPNTGLSDSLNIGFQIAQYDWVARMDGDDVAYSDRFELQMKFADENVAVIGGQVDSINSEGIISETRSNPINRYIIKVLNNLGISTIVHPATIINKRMFMAVKGYDIELFGAEDLDLWLRLHKQGKLINLPNKLLHYRYNTNGVSLSRAEMQSMKNMVGLIKNKLSLLRITHEDYLMFEESIRSHFLYKSYKSTCLEYFNSAGLKRKLYLIKMLYQKMRIINGITYKKYN